MWSVSRSDLVLESLARLRRAKREAERVAARAQFALRRGKRLTPLSGEQVRRYRRDGYLLVPGLISEELLDGAEAAMWEAFGAVRHDPRTWTVLGPRPRVLREGRFIATYTDAMRGAAAQLAGHDVAGFRNPPHAMTVNLVPVSRDWQVHEPHLDCIIPEHRHRTLRPPYRIAALTYLTRVPRHGGGTVVWPASHLKLEALARGEPARYRYLTDLNSALGRCALGDPVELTPSRGEILFHHHLCVHACSDNVSDRPRLAMKYTW